MRHLWSASILIVPLVMGAPSVSSACGFDAPTLLAQASLGWTYPDALHVSGAIWSAQQAGVLAMPDPMRLQARGEARRVLNSRAYWQAVTSLNRIGAGLDEALGDRRVPDLAIVLVETALWSRFVDSDGNVAVAVHAAGPEPDDLVVVTGEPVLHAIADGTLSVSRAVALGVMRLYGTPEQKRVFSSELGAIGEQPLPEIDPGMLYAGVLGLGRAAPAEGDLTEETTP